ncbi:redoxin domain-containing protein [Mucilaginibacter sp. AW1-3]
MSFPINQYPDFELVEIQPELLLQFKKYRKLSPLRAGAIVPEFTFANNFNTWQQFFNGAETYNHLAIRQLLNKPLVISFYSHHWQHEGLDFIKELNRINTEIRANGGNMVVIAEGRNAELQKLAWDNNLTLNFYFDTDRKLAEKFGVYHKSSPVWERFSGIDAHVPLLAAFVVNPYRQVLFSHSNWNAESKLDTDKLLEEVYQAGLYLNTRRSA